MARRIERRHLVAGLGLLGMVVALPSAATSGLLRRESAVSVDQLVKQLFGNLESARQVGHAYLQQAPAEANREVLTASLRDVLAPTGSRRELGRRLRQDFANGNIVTVRGWVLSRTEAQLCGLAVLS